MKPPVVVILLMVACAGRVAGQQSQAAAVEEFARKLYQNGQRFMERGNHVEALRDFADVVSGYPTSSVADDALLEVARFHVETSGDAAAAQAAVTTLLEKYRTSESVPMAYVLAGRIVLMKGRSTEDVERALSQFERVEVFGASDAQSAALHFAAEALSSNKRHADALGRHRQLLQRFPRSPWTVRSSIVAARSLVQLGQQSQAMDTLQRIRSAAPASADAESALAWNTLLYRLYIRPAANQPAFTFVPPTIGGSAGKLRDVLGVLAMPAGEVVAVHKAGAFVLAGAGRTSSSLTGADVRRAFVDNAGRVTLVQRSGLNRQGTPLQTFSIAKTDKSMKPLEDIVCAGQLRMSDYLVADSDSKSVLRFASDGRPLGTFQAQEVRALAINWLDDVAVVDRDGKSVTLLDGQGKPLARIVTRGTGYELHEVVDLQFDALGHLYLLDKDGPRSAVYVFTPAATLLLRHALPDKTPGHFREPAALAVDRAGRLLVYDERVQAIQVHQ